MKHEYSSMALVFVLLLMVVGAVSSIEGSGDPGVIAKFINGGVLGNSSLSENTTTVNSALPLTVQGDIVCTATNGVCNSSSGSINNITNNFYYNFTNNITNNNTNNITNNITNNFSAGVFETNLTKSGSDIILTKQYANGTIRTDTITDTSGGGSTPIMPWSTAISGGGYFQEFDFESVTAGYTELWVPTTMLVGPVPVLTNGSTIRNDALNGVNADPGVVTVSTNGTAGSGYSFQQSGILTYQLKEGWGACFGFTIVLDSRCASSPCINATTYLMGFMDVYTNANVVDGMMINGTSINGTHALFNGVIRNNSVANYTLTNVILANATKYYAMVYANNNSAYFTIYQNGTRCSSSASAIWNGSIGMYSWNKGRQTGHGMRFLKNTGNTTPTWIIGEMTYMNVFMNRSL